MRFPCCPTFHFRQNVVKCFRCKQLTAERWSPFPVRASRRVGAGISKNGLQKGGGNQSFPGKIPLPHGTLNIEVKAKVK